MAIIEMLSGSPQGCTVTDISTEMGINKGLIHRILTSLSAHGYIYKDELTQHYRLSTRLLGLAFRHVRSMEMYDLVLPILRRLSDSSQELAELNWLQNGRLVLVAKAESPRRVKVVDYFGEDLVLHATAGGKVWLANLPEDEALRVLVERGTPKLGDHTITDLAQLQDEFRLIRERGYAINDQESADEVVAVAAPVWISGPKRQVIGAVSVVSPAYRNIHHNPEIIEQTIAAANEIGEIWPFVGLER
ncbi:MAG: IclR family transcriptional regulator [Thermomicrobiales bacterium]|nr:IclR family transcriptional regulator [Thermomicrobiales bacterium]